jgi:uncharacterized repeat protein (TIGR03803 family)
MKSVGPWREAVRLLPICAVAALAVAPAMAGTASVLYSFTGDEDGEYPASELVTDAAGNLYGTTVEGGDFNAGTVFQLSRSGDTWTKTVLHHFAGFADGLNPYGGVAIDAQGNLYGTTTAGGVAGFCAEDGCGVTYRLTNLGGGSWSYGVLHDFTGGLDGWGPGGQPALDGAGNVYGTTPNGGTHQPGVVYKLHPDGAGGYDFRVIHHFTGGDDGGTGSLGRLLVDQAGKNIFGIATVGGARGAGVVYRLRLMPNGHYKQQTLYAFRGAPDAGFPYGGLTRDRQGNLYGTTYYDGAHGYGTVYQLSRSGGVWTERVLHSFEGGAAGNNPSTNLVFDAAGSLYGTTAEGGAPGCHCGTIFKLARDGSGNWTERIVYRFKGSPDGAYSYYSLIPDGAGGFYGATVHGGDDDDGTIYQYTP